jgi:hypothetical protein
MKIFGIVGICVALLVAAPACDKDEKKNKSGTASTDDLKKKANKLVAPAFFKKIPADTVFVFANYERLDAPFVDALASMMAPIVEGSRTELQKESPEAAAFLQEHGDLLTLAGLKKIGIKPAPFFAIYNQGMSVMVRVELADGEALIAFVDKLIAKYGEGDSSLASKTAGSMRYWESPKDDEFAMVVGIDKKELVVSFMAENIKSEIMPYIIGGKTPAKSIVDSKALLDVVAEHGGEKGVGYIDARAAMNFLMSGNKGLSGHELDLSGLSKPCKDEFMQLANIMPRVIFGYDRLDTSAMSMYYGVELREDVAKRLGKMVRPVPGYAYATKADAMATFGVGINIGEAISWARDVSKKVAGSPYQCEDLRELNEAFAEANKAMSQVPAVANDIEGAVMLLRSFDPNNPLATSGMVALKTNDLGPLVVMAKNLIPGMAQVKLEVGAEPTKLDLSGLGVPLDVYAARSKTMLGATVGDARKELSQLLASPSSADGPFFAMNYDYKTIAQFIHDQGDEDPVSKQVADMLARLDDMIFEMNATESGVVMRSGVRFK